MSIIKINFMIDWLSFQFEGTVIQDGKSKYINTK